MTGLDQQDDSMGLATCQEWWSKFDPSDPHGRKRLTPASVPPVSVFAMTHELWHLPIQIHKKQTIGM